MNAQTFQDLLESENNNRTTVIRIIVDASRQFPLDTVNLDYVIIKDNQEHQGNSAATGEEIKNYSSNVFNGNQVIWMLRVDDGSEGQGYSLELPEILMAEDAQCVFDTRHLSGEAATVIGRVTGDSKCGSKSYTVKFILRNADGDHKQFGFDPFLLVNN